MSKGIIYVLTNPSFPHLVKIGKTCANLKSRLGTLYSTGVPTPFQCDFAYEVDDCDTVEKALHEMLYKCRINKNREFFEIAAEKIEKTLSLMSNARLVTSKIEREIDKSLDEEDKKAEKSANARNKNFNFREMGLHPGAEIALEDDENIKVVVVDERKVSFNGEVDFLTATTKKILKKTGQLRPLVYWSYNGKNLLDLYQETYIGD